MIDIDHFKRVNDDYGHIVGDEVIKHLAGIIHHYVRETDVAGRYGGEEYAILLTDTDAAGANVFAERIRAKVLRSIIDYNGIEVSYTVSVGVAQIRQEFKTCDAWIEQTDKALYQSKHNGRNQVTCL